MNALVPAGELFDDVARDGVRLANPWLSWSIIAAIG